jgi:hypothetical protein
MYDFYMKLLYRLWLIIVTDFQTRDCRCRDCTVVGFTTTYAISAHHHKRCEFEFRSWPPWYNWNIVESGIKHHNLSLLLLLASKHDTIVISWQIADIYKMNDGR